MYQRKVKCMACTIKSFFMKLQKGLSTIKYPKRWDIPFIKLKYSIIRMYTIFKRKKDVHIISKDTLNVIYSK